MDAFPVCGASRYMRDISEDEGRKSKRGGLTNVMWYVPIAKRMKRMFMNPKQA